MSNLSDIVAINIDVASPAADSASFDNLLLVGQAPAVPVGDIPDVGVFSELAELNELGYVSIGEDADPIGIAARVAFSQNPKPSKVYIAVQKPATQLLSNVRNVKIITSANWQDLLPAGTYTEEPTTLPWIQFGYSRSDCDKCDVSIEHNGTVWSKAVGISEQPDGFVTAVLGAPTYSGEDALGLTPENFPGTYNITIKAYKDGGAAKAKVSLTFDGTSSTATPPVIPALEPVDATLNRALETTGWYVVCPAGIEESEFENIAAWTEAQTKLFAYTYFADTAPVGDVYFRTLGWYGKVINGSEDAPDANAYMHVAAVAKCLSYPSGSESWANKQLAAVYPAKISGTVINALKAGHLNFFTTYAGKNITQNGQVMSGEWIDVIRGRDWLQNDMQLRIFNLLLTNPKIPFTNSGISLVQNQMIASLKAARVRGIVAEDEYDDDGVLIPGFTTSVPNSASLTGAQKASRILTDCKFSARLAGAIHAVVVNGGLTY